MNMILGSVVGFVLGAIIFGGAEYNMRVHDVNYLQDQLTKVIIDRDNFGKDAAMLNDKLMEYKTGVFNCMHTFSSQIQSSPCQ